jgi:hypothetical protein
LNVFKGGGAVNPKLVMYLAYLVLSLALTAYVARTLFRNGRIFLEDALADERLANSVNHLLVVGFWLLNLGYVGLQIKVSSDIATAADAVENLSLKLGLVLVVVGAVHFFNLYVLSRIRRARTEAARPPVPPTAVLAPTPAPSAPGAPTPAHRAPAAALAQGRPQMPPPR